MQARVAHRLRASINNTDEREIPASDALGVDENNLTGKGINSRASNHLLPRDRLHQELWQPTTILNCKQT